MKTIMSVGVSGDGSDWHIDTKLSIKNVSTDIINSVS